MYNQNYEKKYNNPYADKSGQKTDTFVNSKKPGKKSDNGLTFEATFGWTCCLFFVGFLILGGFGLINRFILPFKAVGKLSGPLTAFMGLIAAAGTYFTFKKLKDFFNLSLKWWQSFWFLWIIYGMCSVLATNTFELLNALDVSNEHKIIKYYVCGRDSKGRSVYNSKTKSKKDIWTYFLYIKPDIESKDNEKSRIEVDRGSYDIAEGGDNWYTYTKPGLFGYEHISKRPHLVHNGIGSILVKRQMQKGTEDYQLKMERMDHASKARYFKDRIKADPKFKEFYEAEFAKHDEAINKIAERERELEIELYRSMQK